MLQILKPKLVRVIQGSISPPTVTTNPLGGINAIVQLLHDAGYAAGVFDANKLLECDQDQVTHACRSLYNKLNPLTGKWEYRSSCHYDRRRPERILYRIVAVRLG